MLFPNPGYVISRQQLILGSDVSLLQHMLDAASGKSTPLTETNAYQDVRKHFRITGGSITFVDVNTAVKASPRHVGAAQHLDASPDAIRSGGPCPRADAG